MTMNIVMMKRYDSYKKRKASKSLNKRRNWFYTTGYGIWRFGDWFYTTGYGIFGH